MNKIIPALMAVCLLASCAKPKTKLHAPNYIQGTAAFGDSIKNGNILDLNAISTAMKNEDKLEMKVRGTVADVCQKKGCWITMNLNNGNVVRVTFKDYKLFIPKDIKGKEVILDGFAYADSISVKDQKHYAEDGGKSEEEIAKITESQKQLSFEAKGVVVL